MSPEEEERRRLRLVAAMAIAGNLTVEALFKRLTELGYTSGRGFSFDQVKDMRSGRRAIYNQDIPILAEACGLPDLFFYIDFATLAEPTLREDVEMLKVQVANLTQTALRAERAIGEWERMDRPAGQPKDEER